MFNSTFIAYDERESETIYAASGTDGSESFPDLDASITHLITDESLLGTWFAHCDEYGTGHVKTSKLVNYIVEITCLKETDNRETLDELRCLLDPTNNNCSVDLPTFREILKNWLVKKQHEITSSMVVYPPSKGYGKKRHSSPCRSPGIMETTSTSLFDCSFEEGLESQDKPVPKSDEVLSRLEHQNRRLLEEKLALEKQLVGLEEQNLVLLQKVPELEKVLQSYQQSIFNRIKESDKEIEQYKLLLNTKEKDLASMTEQLRSYEKQEKDYLEEIENLQKLHEDLDGYKIHELGLTRALQALQADLNQLDLQHRRDEDIIQQERQRYKDLEKVLDEANDYLKIIKEEKEDLLFQLACVTHNVISNPQRLSLENGLSLTAEIVKPKPVACSTPYVNVARTPRFSSIQEELKDLEINNSVSSPFCGKLEESTFDSHLDNRFINDLQQLLEEKKKFVTNQAFNLDLIRNEHEQSWQHLDNAQLKKIWPQLVSKAVDENVRVDAEYQASLYRLLDGATAAAGLIYADIEEDLPAEDWKCQDRQTNLLIRDSLDNAIVPNAAFACLHADPVPSPVEEGQGSKDSELAALQAKQPNQYKNVLGPGRLGVTFARMEIPDRNHIFGGGGKLVQPPARSRKTGLSIVQAPAAFSSAPEFLDSLSYLDLEASAMLPKRRKLINWSFQVPCELSEGENSVDALQDDQVSTSSSWNITQPFPNCTDSLLIKAGVHIQSPWQPESWSEEDIESKFNLLSLSLRTDHVTLQHRLELLLRKRDVTEENLSSELDSFQSSIQSLCTSVATKESAELLKRLEKQIALLRLLTRKISSVAEVLGAVQQEHRLSRAVDLMLMHVDNLKRRWEKDNKDLEEVKLFFEECSSEEQVSSSSSNNNSDSPPVSRIRSLSFSEIVRRRTSLGSPPLSFKASLPEFKDLRHRAANQSPSSASPKRISFISPVCSPSNESPSISKKGEMEKIVEVAEDERERLVFAFPAQPEDSNNNTGKIGVTAEVRHEQSSSSNVLEDHSIKVAELTTKAATAPSIERSLVRSGETRKLSLNTRLQRWLNTCQMAAKEKNGTSLPSPVEQPKFSTLEHWVRQNFGGNRKSNLQQAARICRWSLTSVLLLAAVASLISAFAPCFTERWLMRRPALAEGAYVPFQRVSYATWDDILGTIIKVERLGPVPI